MRIQHNISALNTANALKKGQKATSSNLAKLSSGYSINKAADNAAGLAISEKMRGQIRGMKQASANATDATNLIQTAEGYMKTTNDILQRMRELAVQASNGTYDTGNGASAAVTGNTAKTQASGDRAKINEEIQQLTDELDRIAKTANFNGMRLSNAKFAFQVGANTATTYTSGATYTSTGKVLNTVVTEIKDHTGTGFELVNSSTGAKISGNDGKTYQNAEMITVSIGGFTSGSLGVNAGNPFDTDAKKKGIDLTSQAKANASIDIINDAISRVTSERARLGAIQNRLEYTIDNLDTSIENTTASESAIRDTDMVSEMMDFTKNNVLNQAATAMMAQANTQTQSVLQLLQ